MLDKGREVAGSVVVPVDDQAARLAMKRPLCERQLGFHRLAARASLGAWEPPVCDDQPGAVPLALVGKLAAQLARRGVEDGPVEAGLGPGPVVQVMAGAVGIRPGGGSSGHAGHVQVLYHDGPVGGRQSGGHLVQRVAPLVGHLGMGAGDPGPGATGAPGGGLAFPTGLLAGKLALVAGHAPGMAHQWPGVLDRLPGGEHHQGLHAHIDTDHLFRLGGRSHLSGHLAAEGDVSGRPPR